MNIAYYRGLIDKGHIYWEPVTGCPRLLIDSEPAMVVVKNSVGNLIAYFHFKSRSLGEGL